MPHWTESTFVDDPDLFLRDLQSRVDEGRHETQDLLAYLDDHDIYPDRALDLACGPGVHAIDLAQSGIDIDAIDISDEYIERARQNATEAGVMDRVNFFIHDMCDLDALDQTYELITNRYSSFGYYDDATNEAILAAAYDRLEPGGVLAFELQNREGLLADFEPKTDRVLGDQRHVEVRKYDPETARVRTTHRVFDVETDEQLGEYTTDERVYAPVEIRQILTEIGFDVDLFGSFDGQPLSYDSEGMIAIGWK